MWNRARVFGGTPDAFHLAAEYGPAAVDSRLPTPVALARMELDWTSAEADAAVVERFAQRQAALLLAQAKEHVELALTPVVAVQQQQQEGQVLVRVAIRVVSTPPVLRSLALSRPAGSGSAPEPLLRALLAEMDLSHVWKLRGCEGLGLFPWSCADALSWRSLFNLNLSSAGLTALPGAVGQLAALHVLRLNHNKLTTLPPELGLLGELEVLAVNHNALTTLPAELRRCTALRELHLEHNRLATPLLDLSHATALESLQLHGNPLEYLPELAPAVSLRSLSLANVRVMADAGYNRWEVEVTAPSGSYVSTVMGGRGHKLQPLFNLTFRRSSIQHPLLAGALGRLMEDPANLQLLVKEDVALQQLVLASMGSNPLVVSQAVRVIVAAGAYEGAAKRLVKHNVVRAITGLLASSEVSLQLSGLRVLSSLAAGATEGELSGEVLVPTALLDRLLALIRNTGTHQDVRAAALHALGNSAFDTSNRRRYLQSPGLMQLLSALATAPDAPPGPRAASAEPEQPPAGSSSSSQIAAGQAPSEPAAAGSPQQPSPPRTASASAAGQQQQPPSSDSHEQRTQAAAEVRAPGLRVLGSSSTSSAGRRPLPLAGAGEHAVAATNTGSGSDAGTGDDGALSPKGAMAAAAGAAAAARAAGSAAGSPSAQPAAASGSPSVEQGGGKSSGGTAAAAGAAAAALAPPALLAKNRGRLVSVNDPVKLEAIRLLAVLGQNQQVRIALGQPAIRGRGLRVLAMDGGGMKGMAIVELLRQLERRAGAPIWSLFDVIGGTSTGGLLAVNIGILRLSLDECQESYTSLGNKVFNSSSAAAQEPDSAGWRNSLMQMYQSSSINMRVAVWGSKHDAAVYERLLREFCAVTELGCRTDRLIDTSVMGGPKVFVVSTLASRRPAAPFVFRNFEIPDEAAPLAQQLAACAGSCKHHVWEAVRASSAAPFYFNDFVSPDGLRFQDGATTANNPTVIALQQARLLHPQLPIDCVVSLGCGSEPPADRSKGLSTVIDTGAVLLEGACSTDRVHEALAATLPMVPGCRYFRFNALDSRCGMELDDISPESWRQLLSATSDYCSQPAVAAQFDRLAALLTRGSGVGGTATAAVRPHGSDSTAVVRHGGGGSKVQLPPQHMQPQRQPAMQGAAALGASSHLQQQVPLHPPAAQQQPHSEAPSSDQQPQQHHQHDATGYEALAPPCPSPSMAPRLLFQRGVLLVGASCEVAGTAVAAAAARCVPLARLQQQAHVAQMLAATLPPELVHTSDLAAETGGCASSSSAGSALPSDSHQSLLPAAGGLSRHHHQLQELDISSVAGSTEVSPQRGAGGGKQAAGGGTSGGSQLRAITCPTKPWGAQAAGPPPHSQERSSDPAARSGSPLAAAAAAAAGAARLSDAGGASSAAASPRPSWLEYLLPWQAAPSNSSSPHAPLAGDAGGAPGASAANITSPGDDVDAAAAAPRVHSVQSLPNLQQQHQQQQQQQQQEDAALSPTSALTKLRNLPAHHHHQQQQPDGASKGAGRAAATSSSRLSTFGLAGSLAAHGDGSNGSSSSVCAALRRQLLAAAPGASGLGVLHLALEATPNGLVGGWTQRLLAVVEPGPEAAALAAAFGSTAPCASAAAAANASGSSSSLTDLVAARGPLLPGPDGALLAALAQQQVLAPVTHGSSSSSSDSTAAVQFVTSWLLQMTHPDPARLVGVGSVWPLLAQLQQLIVVASSWLPAELVHALLRGGVAAVVCASEPGSVSELDAADVAAFFAAFYELGLWAGLDVVDSLRAAAAAVPAVGESVYECCQLV